MSPGTAPPSGLRLAVCVQLHDANVANHVRAIVRHPAVREVYIVRSAPVAGLAGPKIRLRRVAGSPPWRRFACLYRECRRLAVDRTVDAVLSFNPIPYGLIAAAAARGRVPCHLGFVGSDLHGWRQSFCWKLLRPVLRRADFVTVTGARMRAECLGFGARPERLAILPHTVETERFQPGTPEGAVYDFIFVGNLIPLKRVDWILEALRRVRLRHAAARLCVVGDGPCRSSLQSLAGKLGLGHAVDFTGYVTDVASYLRRSRILVLASESEGFPFAIVEGACCGLVPVCTRVGTIDEHVRDGWNGLLAPPGDRAALAEAMTRLLDDPAFRARLRERALEMRQSCADEHATAVWDGWFRRLTAWGVAGSNVNP